MKTFEIKKEILALGDGISITTSDTDNVALKERFRQEMNGMIVGNDMVPNQDLVFDRVLYNFIRTLDQLSAIYTTITFSLAGFSINLSDDRFIIKYEPKNENSKSGIVKDFNDIFDEFNKDKTDGIAGISNPDNLLFDMILRALIRFAHKDFNFTVNSKRQKKMKKIAKIHTECISSYKERMLTDIPKIEELQSRLDDDIKKINQHIATLGGYTGEVDYENQEFITALNNGKYKVTNDDRITIFKIYLSFIYDALHILKARNSGYAPLLLNLKKERAAIGMYLWHRASKINTFTRKKRNKQFLKDIKMYLDMNLDEDSIVANIQHNNDLIPAQDTIEYCQYDLLNKIDLICGNILVMTTAIEESGIFCSYYSKTKQTAWATHIVFPEIYNVELPDIPMYFSDDKYFGYTITADLMTRILSAPCKDDMLAAYDAIIAFNQECFSKLDNRDRIYNGTLRYLVATLNQKLILCNVLKAELEDSTYSEYMKIDTLRFKPYKAIPNTKQYERDYKLDEVMTLEERVQQCVKTNILAESLCGFILGIKTFMHTRHKDEE